MATRRNGTDFQWVWTTVLSSLTGLDTSVRRAYCVQVHVKYNDFVLRCILKHSWNILLYKIA